MVDVRGVDKTPRKKYEKTGLTRLGNGQNPEYYRQYYLLNKEKILQRNKEARKERQSRGIKNRVTPQTWRSMVLSLLVQRDGNACALCKQVLDFTDLKSIHIDHKIPYHLTKDDSAENLQLAHATCNIRRSRKHGNIQ